MSMSVKYGISVNLRANQPEGRFYMGLDEALDLYNGGLAQAILDTVERLEQDLEHDKKQLRTAQGIIKRARQAISNNNIK